MKNAIIIFTFCISLSVVHAQNATIRYYDTLTFEQTDAHITIDTTHSQPLWQQGSPAKSLFTEAFRGQNAMVTDTLNPYPANAHSSFTVDLSDYSYMQGNFAISFKHRFDTDTLRDGGFVETSWGDTFYNALKERNRGFNSFDSLMYDSGNTLYNGNFGFSGNSGGWITTQISFFRYFYAKSNNLQLRFVFVSDTIDNPHDGWIIDDLVLAWLYVPGGLHSPNKDSQILVYPNPANNQFRIKHHAKAGVNMELFNVQGKCVMQQELPEDETSVSVSQIEKGMYFLRFTDIESGAYDTQKMLIGQ